MERAMPKNQLERKTVTVEDLALSNAYQLEAMINVLERKGLLTGKEVMDELEVIAATQGKKEVKKGYFLHIKGSLVVLAQSHQQNMVRDLFPLVAPHQQNLAGDLFPMTAHLK